MTPVLLGALALLLAGPVPWLLLRWPGLRRTPAATLLLWQAVALAAVLAALGAGLSLVTSVVRHGGSWDGAAGPVQYLAIGVAGLVTVTVLGRLLLSGHRVGTELRSLRHQHREQVDLVASRDQHGLHVLAHPLPAAWCLPSMRQPRIVISQGLLAALSTEQTAAVVAHEREHLRSRHDLVLEAFTVLNRAFPSWVASAPALREAALLIEILADRAAVRAQGPRALAAALVAVSAAGGPAGSLRIGGDTSNLLIRVHLVADHHSHRAQAVVVGLAAVLLLALPTVLVVRPWLSGLF